MISVADSRFEEACKQVGLGERLDIEDRPGQAADPVYKKLKDEAERLIDSARGFLSELPPIHFNFLHDPYVNAHAFEYRGEYFIAIPAGAVLIPRLFVHRAVAHPGTLGWIGDPRGEVADLSLIHI